MKNIISILILSLLVNVSSLRAQDKFANWPALNDFHTVISSTFHPAEKGNYKPIRERSAEMATKAEALNKSIIPASYDQKQLRKVLKQLSAETKVLDKLVKKNSIDAVINARLIAVHDRFHQIVGLCKDETH